MNIYDGNSNRELNNCALENVRDAIFVTMHSVKEAEEQAIQEEKMQSCIDMYHDTYLLWKTLLGHLVGQEVEYEGDDESDGILCPVCRQEVARNDDYPEMRPKHCPECGCKLIY